MPAENKSLNAAQCRDLHKKTSAKHAVNLSCALNYPLSYITDATGKIVAVNTKNAAGKALDTSSLLGKDMSKASWFRDARDGKFLKSELLDGTVVEDVARDPDAAKVLGSNALFVSFSAPILSGTGDFLGVWRNLADFALVETMITQSTTTVAAAMEEMSSSIQEVARNCAQESEIARKADTQARETRVLMGKLDESARQIGKVVELITRRHHRSASRQLDALQR
jgi:methyl-accepting chemotaxis protein